MDLLAAASAFFLAGLILPTALVLFASVLCFLARLSSLFRRGQDVADAVEIESLSIVAFSTDAIHPTPVGLGPGDLASLPTFAYSAGGKSSVDCTICLSQLRENESVRSLPLCNHCFHSECVDPWLRRKSTCPLCRSQVMPESVVIDLPPVLLLQWVDTSFSMLPPPSLPSPPLSSLSSSNDEFRIDLMPSLGSEELSRLGTRLEWIKHRILMLKRALGSGWRSGDQEPDEEADDGRVEEHLQAAV